MKWSERGPVAWPLIRRSRFIRELRQNNEAHDRHIQSMQRLVSYAEACLYDEKKAHEADLRNVLDYRGLTMERHDEYRYDAVVFHTRMSNTLIHQMSKAHNPRQVAEMVARDLIGQMLAATRQL